MALNFDFSQTGSSHFAQVIGSGQPPFFVGKETVYKGNHGLFNLSPPSGLSYAPDTYKDDYGFWAYFIAPTAKAESNNSFVCLNTYDRARFTFGFMQYAAHVANGDFVRYFRQLLALPNAQDYFPKLVLQNSRIFYRDTGGALTQLENATSTLGLLNYLNPSLDRIENQELICAARMVHWATNDVKHRELQVKIAIELFKENMKEYASSYNLDGYPDRVCQVICDIRHQGRATSRQVIKAINTSSDYDLAYENLLELGLPLYAERIKTIRKEIKKLQEAGIFGKKYDQSIDDFV
ncbi:MAG: hypothetical protein WCK96_17950 [Methylococcales bacterium]